MEHVLLKKIGIHSQQWTVRVRVIRFSDFFNSDTPPKVSRIDLVLLDEQVCLTAEFITELTSPTIIILYYKVPSLQGTAMEAQIP